MGVGNDEATIVTQPRPSLYAAIKLARLVLIVKERFKARLRSRRPPTEPSTIHHRDGLKVRAFDDVNRAIKTHLKGRNACIRLHWDHGKASALELGVTTLLHDLDSQTLSSDKPLSMTARDDELFLKYNTQQAVATYSSDRLRHVFDLTTMLLERLPTSTGSDLAKPRNNNGNDECCGLKCDVFIANLEHMLLCLQQAAIEALIISTIKNIHADILHWQQHQEANEGWFAEWPNGLRPLNTTFPWNVKPSLVVLWGVCWMFFDSVPMTRKLPTISAGSVIPQTSTHIDSSIATVNQIPSVNDATWNDSLLSDLSLQDLWLSEPIVSGFRLPSYASADVNQYISASCAENSSLLASQIPLSWPHYQGNTDFGSPVPNPGNWPFTVGQQEARAIPTSLRIQTQGTFQPYEFNTHEAKNKHESGTLDTGLSLGVPMQDYPSPYSEDSVQGASVLSPGMQYLPSSAVESPENEGSALSVDLARNNDGLLYCTHNDCSKAPPSFSRKCEYTKHMDKHNRPYVCEEPECEKIRGFTYSGGLLRHQREVHRQHGGPKALCKCPHPDCKRSIGTGFSRKENLYEHLRRVHKPIEDSRKLIPNTIVPSPPIDGSSTSRPEDGRKRRRFGEDGEGEGADRDLQRQIKRLRKEVQQRDDRLKKLEDMIEKLAQNTPTTATTL